MIHMRKRTKEKTLNVSQPPRKHKIPVTDTLEYYQLNHTFPLLPAYTSSGLLVIKTTRRMRERQQSDHVVPPVHLS